MSGLDWGLVIAGAGLFFGSSALPGKYQLGARFGGLGLAAVGTFRLITRTGRSFGVLAEKGGIGEWVRGVLFGGPKQAVEAPTVSTDAVFQPPPHVIGGDGVAGVWGGILAPRANTTVPRGLFSRTYPVLLEVTNAGKVSWNGLVRYETQVDHLLESDEQIEETAFVRVAPGETLQIPMDVRLSEHIALPSGVLRAPKVDARMYVGARPVDKVSYTVT